MKPRAPERNTRQKETVRSVFMKMRTHPTAESVVEEVRQVDPSIGRATVYRTLSWMAERGEILRVPVSNGADRFDFTIMPHDHVKCEICGAVDDVFTVEPDNESPPIRDSRGFRITRRAVLYFGICPMCDKNPEEV